MVRGSSKILWRVLRLFSQSFGGRARAVEFGLALVDSVGVAIICGIVFFDVLVNLKLCFLLNFMPLEF